MQEVNSVGAGAAAKTPWLSRALQEGAFQLVFDGLLKSVQVRMSHALLSCFFSYFALTLVCVKGLSLPCQVERMPTSCLTHVRVCWLMQAPTPWTTEHCVALARCMSRMAQLQEALPNHAHFKQVSNAWSYHQPYIRALSTFILSSHPRCSCACFCHVSPTQKRLCWAMFCQWALLKWSL